MPEQKVDQLRAQLRERGYLTRGLERWFALDPWSSRAFWAELFTVAIKAAVVVALFGALPPVAIMTIRNYPLSPSETLLLMLVYGSGWLAVAFAFVILLAFLLKLRPGMAVDTPRALLAITLASSAVMAAPLAVWWLRFDVPSGLLEALIGLALIALFFVVATIVLSAALLSFSVYEVQRVPAIHQKPRTIPLAAAAGVMIALLVAAAHGREETRSIAPPQQVVTAPATRNVALVASDGLTAEIFGARPDLSARFATRSALPPMRGESATERWASVGTGVPTDAHHVRAIEGIVFRGGTHVLQSTSRGDYVLQRLAELAGLTRRQPLPPTVRNRDYIWEIFAGRGVSSLAVDWWTTESTRAGSLEVIGQESIFGRAAGNPIAIDAGSSRLFLDAIERTRPRFATVYLPGLDLVLNRLELGRSERLTKSVASLDLLGSTVGTLRDRGYDVILVGLPGEQQEGHAIVATSFRSLPASSAFDVAPTACSLLGFPPSSEMPGRSLTDRGAPRIASYGTRAAAPVHGAVDREYYESLRSLGYIQ